MVNFLSMPALKMPDNALIDFQGAAAPVMNALSGYRQGMNQQYGEQQRLEQQGYQRGRDAKADSRQQVEWFGKQAAAIDRIQDPAQRGAIWNRILSKHPDAANLGPEYRDPMNGPKLVAAEAGQWRDPREDQLADLKLQGARLDVQKAQRDLSQPNRKVVEVNGRLVEIGDGQAKEIYASPQSANALESVKGAPQGYSWVDPANPQAGVKQLPGFEKPVPGDVAGKVAMMNLAFQNIKKSRGIFERSWGPGDLAKYGAANVPLVGDVGALSGDVGMALRDVRVGVEAALRTMTGAAAPEQEVRRYVDMFSPRPTDSPDSVKQKLDGLMQFMADAEKLVVQGRGVDPATVQPQRSQEVQPPAPVAAQASPKSKQEYDALPSGTSYTAPDGTVRTKP